MIRGLTMVLALAAVLAAGGHDRPMVAAVDPRVLADTAGGRSAHFLVVLRAQAAFGHAPLSGAGRDLQGRRVVGALRAAAGSQTGVRAELDRLRVSYRPYWIVNALAVVGDRRAVTAMARRPDVLSLEPDRAFRGTTGETMVAATAAPRGVEWNVERIGAPALWALGINGQDMVYANSDSGVQWDAPALRNRYRGWNGTSADHAYSWWDAVHGDINGDGTNLCGFDLRAPCDDHPTLGHGTHTMGTAVGDDGAGNQVGVAPGSRWIACRSMDQGVGRPSTYLECLQFFLAPTDLAGQNPDPSRRPNVVGNSYACPPDEGCAVDSLRSAVDNLRAAGVFMAVSTGNEGRGGCATVLYPPATYDSSVSVGATDSADAIAAFSSRGPVNVDGSARPKPDLVAPGVGIRSAARGGYAVSNGTSMAAPHVAGAVLLLWSGLPELRGNVDATEQLLAQTAVHLTTTDGCGGDTSTQTPNNTFGHGRIDVAAAYRAAESGTPAVLAVAGVSGAEGDAGRKTFLFEVTLSRSSSQPVAVSFTSESGRAAAGSDFVAASGRLTFAPGERAKAIGVLVAGDRAVERDESFRIRLAEPENATIGTAVATATIRNDDVDRVRPLITGLAVDPTTIRGTRAVLRFRLSERARTVCRIDRSAGGGWKRVRRLLVPGTQGRNARALVTRGLASGGYRAVCRATDAVGNRGADTTARFRVATA